MNTFYGTAIPRNWNIFSLISKNFILLSRWQKICFNKFYLINCRKLQISWSSGTLTNINDIREEIKLRIFFKYLSSPNLGLTAPGTYNPYAHGSDACRGSNCLWTRTLYRYTRAGLPECVVSTMSGPPPKTAQYRTPTKDTPNPRIGNKIPDPPGIEPGSPGWKAGTVTTTPRRGIELRINIENTTFLLTEDNFAFPPAIKIEDTTYRRSACKMVMFSKVNFTEEWKYVTIFLFLCIYRCTKTTLLLYF